MSIAGDFMVLSINKDHYWENRCKLAEDYIKKLGTYEWHNEALKKWQEFKKDGEKWERKT